MKTCCTCKAAKPLSDFHNNHSSPDGHARACKDCARARALEWNRNHQSPKPKFHPPEGHKTCKKCGYLKPLSEFRVSRRVGTRVYHHSYCKACQSAYNKARYTRTTAAYKRIMTDPHLMSEIEAECSQRRMSLEEYELRMEEASKRIKTLPNGAKGVAYYEQEMEKLRLRPEDIPEEAPDLY